jgi:trans-2,3-dihydro-3-hydroxyanthranilate isomerase
MRRRFFTLDVFTARRFAGNPLAVVVDGEGLDAAAMQTVAGEFNLPETVFVLPPDAPSHRARLRIFTPARELPFAGHPTVGTAVLLAHIDGGKGGELILGENVGPVVCTVRSDPEGGHAQFQIPRLPESVGSVRDIGKLSAALGLSPEVLGFERFTPENWSAGNAFSFVPVRDLAVLGRARPDSARWADAVGPNDPAGVFLFCPQEPGRPGTFRARMFAPGLGVTEDPATGSAVAAFAGVLAAQMPPGDGEHTVAIEQGVEMGRPSVLELGMMLDGGRLTHATVGGDAVLVSEGMIEA